MKTEEIQNYVNQYGITGTKQDEFYNKITYPIKGNVYYTKTDIYYTSLKFLEENLYEGEELLKVIKDNKFIREYEGEKWVVIPKNTKLIYLGYDMSGDVIDIKGAELHICSWYNNKLEDLDIKDAIE